MTASYNDGIVKCRHHSKGTDWNPGACRQLEGQHNHTQCVPIVVHLNVLEDLDGMLYPPAAGYRGLLAATVVLVR